MINPSIGIRANPKQARGRSYVSRLGYNTGCSSYTQGVEICRLSGSSINRAEALKRKNELQNLLEKKTQIVKTVGANVYEFREYEQEISDIRADLLHKQRTKNRVPRASNRGPMSLHVLSQRSKGKIRDKFTAFYRACGDKKTFATLTFINAVSDTIAIKILNKFFTALRDDFENVKYAWVAERQTENKKYPNNIHFHIIINKFLPVAHYNYLWIVQQYNAGLRFEDYTLTDIRRAHADDTLKNILNPFDVKKIRTIYGLSWYLTKYITKNQSTGFQCAAWHCSRSVSRLFTKTVVGRSCMAALNSFRNTRIKPKTGEVIRGGKKIHAFYQLYYIENKIFFLPEMAELEMVNSWILDGWPVGEIPKENDYSILEFYCN